jgi:hypothetical protein
MPYPCGVLVWDRRATRERGRVVWRPCGAPSAYIITMNRDHLFAVCGRHNARLARAGVSGFTSTED